MMAAAASWVETPLHNSHIFVVPHIMQRSFGRVHKNFSFLGQHNPSTVPGITTHLRLVPVLLFYLQPHRHSLESFKAERLDFPTAPQMPAWVANQVAHMRGMS
jgi:hypothetical protein